MRLSFLVLLSCCLGWNFADGQAPTIENFSPAVGLIGNTVTITGTNFSSVPTDNIVLFGSARAAVTSATATELTALVPLGATYQLITVTVNGLTTASANPFVVVFGGEHGLNASSFSLTGRHSTGGLSFNTIIRQADFDGDGKVDLATANYESENFSVLRNSGTGPGNFSYEITTVAAPRHLRITVGDLDGDTKPEVVLISDRTLAVYHNISSGPGHIAFSRIDFATDPNSAAGIQVAIGDLDRDGKPELVMTADVTQIFRNTSSGAGNINFVFQASLPSPGYFVYITEIGDFNGDGKADLITIGSQGNEGVIVYQNTTDGPGNFNFVKIKDYASGAYRSDVAIGDIDGDAKPDLVVPAQSGYFSVYLNSSNASTVNFDEQIKINMGASAHTVSEGDLDGDGKVDLCIGGDKPYLFRNISTPGNVRFEPAISNLSDVGPSIIGDQDGDGKSDIMVYGGTEIAVWSNNVPGNISGRLHQSVSFSLTPKKYGDPAFSLPATASSGLPVLYTSSDASKATISGNIVTIKAPGVVTISARQGGNETFEPAEASGELVIQKGDQSLDFQTITAKTVGAAAFDLSATASSGLPFELVAATDNIAVQGTSVTILKAGSATIVAKQNGNDYYNSAPDVTQTFCVNPGRPVIDAYPLASGAMILVSSSSSGNQWYKDGAPINDAVNNLYITDDKGTYTVKVTVDNCSSEFSEELAPIVTGILETEAITLHAYPNPARSNLSIDLTAFSENGEVIIVIYDRSGRIVEQYVREKGIVNISVIDYSPGLYFVQAKQANKKLISKFVKG